MEPWTEPWMELRREASEARCETKEARCVPQRTMLVRPREERAPECEGSECEG